MGLGAFSVSLAVTDLNASKEFYENQGFEPFGGDPSQSRLIMKHGSHVIGLFQGMFESNIMTFNPGWDQDGNETEKFTDIREIQRQLKAKGVSLGGEIDESTSGPASSMLADPYGNQILIDQHR
jgi:lactoylglutathione lyase